MDNDNEETQPTLVLDFGGGVVGTFRAYEQVNQFLLARHADDMVSGGYRGIKAVTVLSVEQVVPDDRPALEQFLMDNGRNEEYFSVLSEGLGKCWQGETGLPLERSSDSSDTSSSPETEQPSKDDSSSEGMTEEEHAAWIRNMTVEEYRALPQAAPVSSQG